MKKLKAHKFTITITDVNGSRHFHLSQIIKKVALYTILFILAFLVFSAFYIDYLNGKVTEISNKREDLIQKSKELEKANEKMQESVAKKAEEYSLIENKIALFEEQLGLDSENNLTLNARLDKLNLTNEQQIGVLLQIPNGYPIENRGITGNYGWRDHPVLNRKEFHSGIDLRAPIGTPIYAPANGVVEFSSYNSNGYGYMIILVHNFGFKTVYAHMTRKDVVQPGEFVTKGQLIGYTGNTGVSTGPHLHYEVRFINKTLEPLYFLNLTRKNMDKFFNQERRVPWQSLIKAISTQASQKQQ
ncbi:M23 family peptidase [Campylobacter sp. MIT 99-7217]|uniref:M23 family metallopeptidase n=1 Tax=Campylobacter sp. MIT 99-7217 TaxID=535091 RepID=UPI0011579185|nr:M23 family metallopeptidase [Campylobacter sp. MIT 99-7217]TQR33683.1 M23 family peptidase [Campylobacter sp. MIT 99-7217]